MLASVSELGGGVDKNVFFRSTKIQNWPSFLCYFFRAYGLCLNYDKNGLGFILDYFSQTHMVALNESDLGCQMVYLHIKIPRLVYFGRHCNGKYFPAI
jgi:hypothetical protein